MQVRQRQREDYAQSFAAMRAFTDSRTPDTEDEIWIVEHDPVYTLGLAADRSHVLNPGTIPVVQTDRGGEVTYHGPGQVVAYLLLDLKRGGRKLFARELVHQVEQAVIDTLAAYNLRGVRKPGAPGIYIADDEDAHGHGGAKIAALGLKLRASGLTYHGVALNVNMDLEPFSRINPCGYAGLETVDMKSMGVNATLEQVQAHLCQHLLRLLSQH